MENYELISKSTVINIGDVIRKPKGLKKYEEFKVDEISKGKYVLCAANFSTHMQITLVADYSKPQLIKGKSEIMVSN